MLGTITIGSGPAKYGGKPNGHTPPMPADSIENAVTEQAAMVEIPDPSPSDPNPSTPPASAIGQSKPICAALSAVSASGIANPEPVITTQSDLPAGDPPTDDLPAGEV